MWPLTRKQFEELIFSTKSNDTSLNESTNDQFFGINTDSRSIHYSEIFIALKGEKFDGHSFLKNCFSKGCLLALVDKNSTYVSELNHDEKSKCIMVEDVVEALRTCAKNFRQSFTFPIIGVGGSNGKTTTKEMISSLVSYPNKKVTKTYKSENGFIGVALTLLNKEHKIDNPPSALILEIGIDEIGAMEQHVRLATPDNVVLTALGPEHLNGLKDWDTAAREEYLLFQLTPGVHIWQLSDEKLVTFFNDDKQKYSSTQKDYLVINQNEKSKYLNELNNFNYIIWNVLSQSENETTLEIKVKQIERDAQLTVVKVPLPGIHNASNFVCALGCALSLNISLNECIQGFKSFTPPSMRSKISKLNETTVLYNDCYNSSPNSLIAAFESLNIDKWKNKQKIFILGDMLDLGDQSKYWHEYVCRNLKTFHNTYLCLFGSAMYDCYKRLKEDDDSIFHENLDKLFWLSQDHSPNEFLEKLSPFLNGSVILVKGSRGMLLERFVESLEKLF